MKKMRRRKEFKKIHDSAEFGELFDFDGLKSDFANGDTFRKRHSRYYIRTEFGLLTLQQYLSYIALIVKEEERKRDEEIQVYKKQAEDEYIRLDIKNKKELRKRLEESYYYYYYYKPPVKELPPEDLQKKSDKEFYEELLTYIYNNYVDESVANYTSIENNKVVFKNHGLVMCSLMFPLISKNPSDSKDLSELVIKSINNLKFNFDVGDMEVSKVIDGDGNVTNIRVKFSHDAGQINPGVQQEDIRNRIFDKIGNSIVSNARVLLESVRDIPASTDQDKHYKYKDIQDLDDFVRNYLTNSYHKIYQLRKAIERLTMFDTFAEFAESYPRDRHIIEDAVKTAYCVADMDASLSNIDVDRLYADNKKLFSNFIPYIDSFIKEFNVFDSIGVPDELKMKVSVNTFSEFITLLNVTGAGTRDFATSKKFMETVDRARELLDEFKAKTYIEPNILKEYIKPSDFSVYSEIHYDTVSGKTFAYSEREPEGEVVDVDYDAENRMSSVDMGMDSEHSEFSDNFDERQEEFGKPSAHGDFGPEPSDKSDARSTEKLEDDFDDTDKTIEERMKEFHSEEFEIL